VVTQARTSLALRIRASHARVDAGGRVTYKLTVRNRGAQPALAVRVCDRLPAGLTFTSARGARFDGRTACWTFSRLAGRRSTSLTIHARADNVRRSTRITNRATAKGSNTAAVAGRVRVTIDPAATSRPGGVTG
jgi:uncharacterized repeat protein (TIGR01451 family)